MSVRFASLSAPFLASALVAAGMLALPHAARADACSQPDNLVQNCGFEAGGASPTLSPWIDNGVQGLDFVDTSPGDANSGSNSYTFGNSQADGVATLSQQITDISGAGYTLRFFVASNANQGNTDFQVSWDGGAPLLDLSGLAAFGYTEYDFPVAGTGSDTLTFSAFNDPGNFFLDDVQVIPEPGVTGLLATALVALATLRRRRRD